MNTVTVHDGELLIEPNGLDKVWALKSALRFPLAHVLGATFDPGVAGERKGLRAPGLSVPGKTSGTFWHDGDKVFCNVSDRRDDIVLELRDEAYRRVIVTARDPRTVEQLVNAALSAYAAAESPQPSA